MPNLTIDELKYLQNLLSEERAEINKAYIYSDLGSDLTDLDRKTLKNLAISEHIYHMLEALESEGMRNGHKEDADQAI